ncbi:MAG: hypothetical protein AAB508_05440 [Patescibacteria group bacterium]
MHCGPASRDYYAHHAGGPLTQNARDENSKEKRKMFGNLFQGKKFGMIDLWVAFVLAGFFLYAGFDFFAPKVGGHYAYAMVGRKVTISGAAFVELESYEEFEIRFSGGKILKPECGIFCRTRFDMRDGESFVIVSAKNDVKIYARGSDGDVKITVSLGPDVLAQLRGWFFAPMVAIVIIVALVYFSPISWTIKFLLLGAISPALVGNLIVWYHVEGAAFAIWEMVAFAVSATILRMYFDTSFSWFDDADEKIQRMVKYVSGRSVVILLGGAFVIFVLQLFGVVV